MQKYESMALVLNEDFWLRFYISGYSSKQKCYSSKKNIPFI
jgi:hypothetical protein